MKFLVAGINYFTKWVEAKPLANIIEQNVRNFVWKNIICHFGIPRVLVSEMDTNLITHPSKSFVSSWELGITTPYLTTHRPIDRQKLRTDP